MGNTPPYQERTKDRTRVACKPSTLKDGYVDLRKRIEGPTRVHMEDGMVVLPASPTLRDFGSAGLRASPTPPLRPMAPGEAPTAGTQLAQGSFHLLRVEFPE